MHKQAVARPAAPAGRKKAGKKKRWSLFFLALPFMIFILLFKYVPIGGWVIGLYDYRPGIPLFDNRFIGLKYFVEIFKDRGIMNSLKNTLIFSGIGYLRCPCFLPLP